MNDVGRTASDAPPYEQPSTEQKGMSVRAMVWTYAAIEAAVLIPLVVYLACHR